MRIAVSPIFISGVYRLSNYDRIISEDGEIGYFIPEASNAVIRTQEEIERAKWFATMQQKNNQQLQPQNWKNLVPNAVSTIIEKLDGVKRIEMLLGSDSYPQQW